jgi:hypothetical protein
LTALRSGRGRTNAPIPLPASQPGTAGYRVGDELFRAELNGGGLGKPLAIASGDEVVQAHWAFLSSEGPESGH